MGCGKHGIRTDSPAGLHIHYGGFAEQRPRVTDGTWSVNTTILDGGGGWQRSSGSCGAGDKLHRRLYDPKWQRSQGGGIYCHGASPTISTIQSPRTTQPTTEAEYTSGIACPYGH